jgi:3-hydroxyisobutyrate dehydrogenase-like beta-hydroxyacid dehydrogenase
MGRGMAKNLVEKGNLSQPLILYNRTTQRAEELSAKLGSDKTKGAKTIEEAVKPSDFIFTCVGEDPQIKEIIETAIKTPGGVRGKLFCDCSTVHPDTTNELAQRLTGEGAQFVACPGRFQSSD